MRFNVQTEEKESSGLFFSFRFFLAFLIFLGIAIQYTQKIDMGIGIICMVNHTATGEIISSSANHKKCLFQSESGVKQVNGVICLFILNSLSIAIF